MVDGDKMPMMDFIYEAEHLLREVIKGLQKIFTSYLKIVDDR